MHSHGGSLPARPGTIPAASTAESEERIGPSLMSQFWGMHQNRRDAKGRVSIPAPFRVALRNNRQAEANGTIVLRPSHKFACIEAWPIEEFQRLSIPLESLELFSEEYEDLAAALYADAFPVECDKEGRVLLPESLVRHASLGDAVVFLGLGRTFQIWEPQAAEQRRNEARERARTRGFTLPPARLAVARTGGAG